ncbi:MAG: hypothetical protein EXR72_26265 [Myxococcales bacterium]|nr:hypothetical protein [Myxococcales bacterium]
MRAALLAALVVLVPAPPVRAAPDGGVIVLRSPGSTRRDALLIEQLRIYMRDLGRAVRLGGDAPVALGADDLAPIVESAAKLGGEIAVWFGGGPERPVLYALHARTMDLRETEVESADFEGAARTGALKVRALLTRGPAQEDGPWTPVVAPPAPPATAPIPVPPAPPSSTPVIASSPSGAPIIARSPPAAPLLVPVPAPPTVTTRAAPATAPIAARPAAAPPAVPSPVPGPAPAATIGPGLPPTATAIAPPRPPRSWVEASVGYVLSVPTVPEALRHGGVIRATVPLPRVPLALFVDVQIASRPTVKAGDASLAVSDLPIGIGGAYRWRRAKVRLAIGPRVSLHIIDAEATAPGRRNTARRFSAGLGLLAEATYMPFTRLGGIVSLGGEVLLPREQFTGANGTSADLGWGQLTLSAGLVVALP